MNIEKLILSTISKKDFVRAKRQLSIRYLATFLVLFIISFFILYFLHNESDSKIPLIVFQTLILSLIFLLCVDLFLPEKFMLQSNVDAETAKGLLFKILGDFLKKEDQLSLSIEITHQVKSAFLAIDPIHATWPEVRLVAFDKQGHGLASLTCETLMLFSKGEVVLTKNLLKTSA